MTFDLLTYVNCLIETVVLLMLWKLLVSQSIRKREYAVAFLCMGASSVLITMMDVAQNTILLINFILVFLSMLAGFHRLSFRDVLLHSIFAYLALLYIQSVLVCLLPPSLLGSQWGNLVVNVLVLLCTIVATLLGQRMHWAGYYESNKRAAWAFILALYIPQILLAQVFVQAIGNETVQQLIMLVLLQLLYMCLIVVLFLVLRHNSERKRLADTQRYIETLNDHLNDSRQNAHDFKKHIRYLRNTVATRSKDPALIGAVEDYCAELIEAYSEDEIYAGMDNPVLRALLYGRHTQAAREHIRLELQASTVLPAFPVKDHQLVELFDNLMDNAFECVQRLPEDQRWIRVVLSADALPNGLTQHSFCIENPYETVDMDAVINEKRYSSKEGHQGVGLRRVSRTVTETGGRLALSGDNGVFSAKVLYVV